VKPDQTEIIYSLYGVVEHSGQMGGGHYVAYVKVKTCYPLDVFLGVAIDPTCIYIGGLERT